MQQLATLINFELISMVDLHQQEQELMSVALCIPMIGIIF